jgi:membrane protein implicated in regulation of membrane protease activity
VTVTNPNSEPVNRGQRVLATMVAGLVVLSLLCFAASMIGYFTGALAGGASGIWVLLIMIPWFGLPLALLLTIALLIVTSIRRSRENRRG